MTETQTKTRSEAPIAALILGAVAFIAGFIATTPGVPLIAGAIAVIAGLYAIVKARQADARPDWMGIVGVVLAVCGIFVSVLTYG